MFISQSPTVESEVLFATVPYFVESLDRIAAHVTGAPGPPITFAVYGRWGAGKSTALQRLTALIKDRAKRSDGLEVSMSYYSAPVWQETANPQASLAYTILEKINPGAVFEALAGDEPFIVGDELNPRRFLEMAESFGAFPALHEQWMRRISKSLAPERGKRHVHVVLVDDLDRCSQAFTTALLAATTLWGNRRDEQGPDAEIFFVLAAREEHLLDSLAQELPPGIDTPQEALQKYVHVPVRVPDMLTNPRQVAQYLVNLCDVANDVPEQIEDFKGKLQQAGERHPNHVLAPLVEVPSHPGSPSLTPRAVKQRFNAFLVEFRPPPGGRLEDADLKEWVVKAFWLDFWERFIWPLGRTDSNGLSAADRAATISYLNRLVDYGKTLLPLWGLGDEQLGPVLGFLAARHGQDLRGADPALVMLLAVDPPWSPGSPGEAFETVKTVGAGSTESDLPQVETEGGSLDDEVLLDRLRAEQELERGNERLAEEYLQRILQLADGGVLGKASGATVGNAALTAGRMGLAALARKLHLRAHELDDSHHNVMQNLVEFVVDEKQDDLFPLAWELLDRLERHGLHRPERTRRLRVQLGSLSGREPDPADVQQLLDAVRTSPTLESLAQVLSLDRKLVPPGIARSLAKVVASARETDDERYAALRMAADHVALSDERDDEREAVALYRFLLDSGLACRQDPDRARDVWSNLGTLYGSMGYRRAAAIIFRSLYLTRPDDPHVRRRLAVTLDNLDHEEAAQAVLLGQDLPEIEIEPELEVATLAEGIDAWWADLPIGDYPPCELPGDLGGTSGGDGLD